MDVLNTIEYEFTTDTREGVVTLHTSGTSSRSKVSKAVRITGFSIWTDGTAAEVTAAYNTDDWNPKVDGLIYTDPTFLEELKAYFTQQGVDARELNYSEHCLQNENYVHLTAGEIFSCTAIAILPEDWIKHAADDYIDPNDLDPDNYDPNMYDY